MHTCMYTCIHHNYYHHNQHNQLLKQQQQQPNKYTSTVQETDILQAKQTKKHK